MAGISIGMPFNRQGAFPVDERITLSKDEMLATDDTKMPNVYFAVCKEDGKMYVYNKDATPSPETGKYRLSSGDVGTPLTNSEIQAIVDNQYTAVFG